MTQHLLALFLASGCLTVLGAELTVTSSADSGVGTLRATLASAAANAEADTIRFSPALAGQVISLTTNDAYTGLLTKFGPTGLVIHGQTVTLDGSDAPFLSISGANARRVFAVTTTGNLTLRNLTITGGFAKGGKGGDGTGCGHGGGGGAGIGGGVWAEGALQVSGCTFSGNQAVGGKGGAPGGQSGYSGTGGGGGGFGQDGQNGALGGAGASPGGSAGQNYGDGAPGAFGGGGGGGGGSLEYSPNATGAGAAGGFGGGNGGWQSFDVYADYKPAPFGGSGNTGAIAGSRSGGGGAAMGGAIFLKNGSCSLVNSTFYGNSATGGTNSTGSGGSGEAQGAAIFNYQGQLSVLNCTVAENNCTPTFANASGAVSGISGASETSARGSVSIFNTIIVSAADTTDAGFWTFNGGSFASDASGNNALGGVKSGIHVQGFGYSHTKLGPLADNGGPTATVLPASDSNALFDGGDAAAAAGLSVDQRGQPRFAASKLDIGAVQVTLGPPGIEASAAAVSGLSADLAGTVTLEGGAEVTERGFVWSISATNPDPLIDGTGVTRVVNANASIGQYSTTLAGLAANTAYTFKAYATNSIGTAYSAALTFTTNQAPLITSNGATETATLTIPENSTTVTTVSASDADLPAQQISYSILGGADAAEFTIGSTSGALSFVQAPDFDVPGDANGDGVFEVTVQATDDGNTPRMDSQQISVILSDVAEAPLLALTSSASITPTRATLGGTVLHDGGSGEDGMIIERGVVYSPTALNATPTLTGAGCEHRATAGTTGLFTLPVDDLSPGTAYAYRAYATNASGTAYGPVATLTTGSGPVLNGDYWTHVAGSTSGASGTTNGTGTAARFNGPKAITADSNDDLFVADTLSHTARKIVGTSVSTQLGVAGTAGSNNQALFTSEKFNSPSGITFFDPTSGAGQYFIADTANHTIRKASWTLLAGWTITTHVGTAGSSGLTDGSGAAARFLNPQGVAADASGNVYVADTGNHTIRRIDSSQAVTTVVPKLVSTAAYWGISMPGVASSWNGSFTQLSLGYSHTLGVKSDGTVAAWGTNGVGETAVPEGLGGVTAVAAGHQHSLALKSNGTVVAWGLNTSGQSTVPSGLAGVTEISARESVSLALRNDGTVAAWGDNTDGQTTVPAGLSGVMAISAGQSHCLALKGDGTIVGWGNNLLGQASSVTQQSIDNAVAIAAGGSHSMALLADGTVRCWGANDLGQCNVPADLSGVTAIGAGNYFSYALKQDGSLVSWGWNGAGVKTVPASVTGRLVTALSVGPSNVAVLMNEELNAPAGVAVDASGRVLIADTGNHVVRRYDPATGDIVLIAGRPGVAGAADGVGTDALLSGPRGITVDTEGNIYVTQTGDHTIRWITPDGRVRNVGGLPGTSGLANGSPENARFHTPGGIAAIGTTLYVADTGNNRIVKGTPLNRPMAGVGATSNVTHTAATLNGWVNPNGKVSTARFEYGLTETFGSTAAVSLASTDGLTGQISQADLTGLTADTTYHFRLVATNADGSTASQTGTFTTAGPPTLASAGSSEVTTTTATLSGEILDDDGLTVTARGFVYSKAAINALPVLDGSGVTAVSLVGGIGSIETTLSGLEAGTAYSFRAYATNAAGTAYSDTFVFTTAALTVVFDNTAGGTEDLGQEANGVSPSLAFGYRITTGDGGYDLSSITLGLRDFELATALQIRLYLGGSDALPSGAALATQDYPSQSFGLTAGYHTFPLSGFRLKANTSYILFVGASSGGANWSRYEPNIDPRSDVGWTVNSMLVDSYGSFYNMAGNPDRWSIRLAGTPFTASAPTVAAPVASDITPTSASIGGGVTDDGGAGITEFGFVYAPSALVAEPVIDAANVVRVTGTGSAAAFTANLTGMSSNTEYVVRAYATNAAGTSYGTVGTFSTPVPEVEPPIVFRAASKAAATTSISVSKLTSKSAGVLGTTVSVASVAATSEQGGTAALAGAAIQYTPALGFSGVDRFRVTFTSSTGTIVGLVEMTTAGTGSGSSLGVNPARLTPLSGGRMGIQFNGLPGVAYQLQRSTDLTSWTTIATITAGSRGEIDFTDDNPPAPNGFYRLFKP